MGKCSIPDCDRDALVRGWCNLHYLRWQRNGDPLALVVSAKGEALRFFEEVALAYNGKECLIWPHLTNEKGYGLVWRNGRTRIASRLLCEITRGAPPTPKHEAAHRCGNAGCVNPHHIRWATGVENAADCLLHGTRNRGERHGQAKITEAQARKIIELKGRMPRSKIAQVVGTTRTTVEHIHYGRSWAHLQGEER